MMYWTKLGNTDNGGYLLGVRSGRYLGNEHGRGSSMDSKEGSCFKMMISPLDGVSMMVRKAT